MTATELSVAAKDILTYLSENTLAEDCLKGIVKWWLLEKHRTREVKRALHQLVADNLLCGRLSTDLRIHYSMNKIKLPEIQALLKREGPEIEATGIQDADCSAWL
jgi:hypothetical protein